MSKTSVCNAVFSETRLKPENNFVLPQKLLFLVMNKPFNKFWQQRETWNRAIVLGIGLRAFLKKWFNFSNFATSWKDVEFNRKIAKLDIDRDKTWAPSFKILPDKLSMSAALDGLKPLKILNIFQETFVKIENSNFLKLRYCHSRMQL